MLRMNSRALHPPFPSGPKRCGESRNPWRVGRQSGEGGVKYDRLIAGLLVLLFFTGCSSSKVAPGNQTEKQRNIPGSESSFEIVADSDSGSDEIALLPEWQEQLEAIEAGEIATFQTKSPANLSLLKRLLALDGKLEDVLLDGGGVDEDAILVLAEIRSLWHLRIRLAPLGDESLKALAREDSKLAVLNLPHAKLTKRGIALLKHLPSLRQLRISGAGIDDAAAVGLAQLRALESLHLIGPSLTSGGLKALESSPNLSSLYVDDCALPDAAWESMFAAKPKLHVHIDQHHHDRDPSPDHH